MKQIATLFVVVLSLFTLMACGKTDSTTYEIKINASTPTVYTVGDEIDYNDFFIITDSKGNTITTDSTMIDSSKVDMSKPGTYTIHIDYKGIKKDISITVNDVAVTYSIEINNLTPTQYTVGDQVDYVDFFIIKDSKGNTITTELSMLDVSLADMSKAGTYLVKIEYQGITEQVSITVIEELITYTVTIDTTKPTEFTQNSGSINFKDYFILKDSKGQTITVLDSMIDSTSFSIETIGTYEIHFNYENLLATVVIDVIQPKPIVASDLFISEYGEGSSYNKYIELFNATGNVIDLSQYSLKVFNNAKEPAQYEVSLDGILKDGKAFVIYNAAADTAISSIGNLSDPVTEFNGNDPIALYKNGVLIDVVGIINQSVADGYQAGNIDKATKDNTIIRNPEILGPNATYTPSEWTVLGRDIWTNIHKHVITGYVTPIEPENPETRKPDLFISEIFEGSGDYQTSKYIEIYNNLGYEVDLSLYSVYLYTNKSQEPSQVLNLTGLLGNLETYVIYAPNSSEDIKLKGDLSSEVLNFSGKEVIALAKNDVIIDLFGRIGEDPGNSGWPMDDTKGSVDVTLIRNLSVTMPSSTFIETEWIIYNENFLFDLGKHGETENTVISDFDLLFTLIKSLNLNDKGTATGSSQITIKGTVFMDVKNETTLVYITDGKNFIKLHGEKIHNYTSPDQVYQVVGDYKSFLYQPTFGVTNPQSDIIAVKSEAPVEEYFYKEVSLSEVVSLKKENFLYNLEQGYLQSMLKVRGFLQLDTHNSTRYDYALTVTESYTKNNTQYINNGLYFKNDIGELEDFLIDYEVVKGEENVEVDIFGVLYDWNPNRKNWRLYVSDELTYQNLVG